ncbi:acyl-CoA synthetase (NDP forming)/GNAT superfamily N-acetyltransferase [Allocatelliglobosispora scoriae]|uniref:Acyl-CoA synthetase (NDP forming)/GNAT superfamily N-acetyltransferase n=1 Tax=Allocatelliglobosispora scoriae TaxID=643052 RepID=A0A841BXU3_9ACTN|nr:bifunctional GNAT family N-acetyltransferase/acetate--CoA ligase family protein [Allocatelliglobosispora scoriae]MBB5872356.1 acyl-CoA synthetase (NDP forming)/GNAT superfamily N-acetyltransferase [Allocatelliglobosispora scoriae]
MGRDADVLLADGSTVHMRQIEPSDADAIVAMHGRFSDRTRYLRYFSPYPRIPQRDLDRFVTVDHADREALIIEVGDEIIAVGRYERLGPDSEEAEVAFVVADAHQGRGIGSVLLEHLAAAAGPAGIKRFVAEVLPVNGTMVRVFSDAGYQVTREYADGVVHLTFPIAPTERSLGVQQEREHRTEAASIARLLHPRGIVVYGASATGRGPGAAVLRHLREGGYAGHLHVVHPSATVIAGLPVLRSAADAPDPVDLAIVAVPVAGVPAVVADAAKGGCHGVLVITAGYAEVGAVGAAAQDDLVRQVRAAGLRLIGPGSLGVAHRAVDLNATLSPQLPEPGRVACFAQSGTLALVLLAELQARRLGLSSVVSVGNRADVSGNDLLQFWRDDPATDVILMYLETFGNPRKFSRLARTVGRTKPIVALAAPSRGPGLRNGPDQAAMAALVAHSGVITVNTVAELADVGLLLAGQPLPAGRRVGIVTNSAALGALATASVTGAGLVPAEVEVLSTAVGAAAFAVRLAAMLADAETDSLVVVLAPPLPTGAVRADDTGLADFATALTSVAAAGEKPVVAAFMVGPPPTGVPAYRSVEEAVRALAKVCGYADWLRTPLGVLPVLDVAQVKGRAAIRRGDPVGALAAYGVDVVTSVVVESADDAQQIAAELGLPVAMKVFGHRNRLDLGAVRLDLRELDDVSRAYRELVELFGAEAEVLVQPMVAPGVACVVEVVDDPAFGPVIGFGLGGVAAELFGDRAWRAVPLTDFDASGLVRAPRGSELLRGYRGAPEVDLGRMEQLLLRVAQLADDVPELGRLVLDPVLARPDGFSVLHVEFTPATSQAQRPDTGPRRLRPA